MLMGFGGAAREDADPILDEAYLSELAIAIGQDGLKEVLLSARANLARLRMKLSDAAAAGDMTSVRKIAHALLGTCAQIGAFEVRVLASFISGEAQTLDEIRALMLDLNNALDFLDANLAARVSSHSS